jgi:hypothetical protein
MPELLEEAAQLKTRPISEQDSSSIEFTRHTRDRYLKYWRSRHRIIA